MGDAREVLIRGGLVMAGALVLGIILLLARRRHRQFMADDSPTTFSLKDLEAMRDAGQISREEFSRLRRIAMGLGETGEKGKSLSSAPGELDDGNRDAEGSSDPREDEEQR